MKYDLTKFNYLKHKGIYAIRNGWNGKRYIGQARNVFNRWLAHKVQLRKGKHHSIKLQRAWNKDGEQSFVFEVLEIVVDNDLTEREQWWMDHYNACKEGYNIAPIAASQSGSKRSPEFCKRLSEQRKQWHRDNPDMRYVLRDYVREHGYTEEQKQRRNTKAKAKGRVVTEETKEKIRKSVTGFRHSEETKLKMSKSKTGVKKSPEHVEKMRWTPEYRDFIMQRRRDAKLRKLQNV
jgi:group I intron endonuclease